jgi:predicted PurR-regulated permease PerM
MSPEIVAIAVGIILTWLIFTWLVKVLKASLSTALTIAFLLFVLQFFFGIHYQQIWQDLTQVIQQILSLSIINYY